MATFSENSYLIDEIVDYYSALRMQSISREEALKMIFREYNSEYNDEDEKPYLNIAIAIALSKKNEMTPQIRIEALQAANQLGKRNMAGFSQAKKDKLIQALNNQLVFYPSRTCAVAQVDQLVERPGADAVNPGGLALHFCRQIKNDLRVRIDDHPFQHLLLF